MASMEKQTPFGKAMRQQFSFDHDYIPLNHGSYGTIPRQVQTQQRHYQNLVEAAPDKYLLYTFPPLLDAARKAAAKVLNASATNVVFVHNATTAINTILRNIVFEPNDAIIHFDTTYGAIKRTILSILETTPGLHDCAVDYHLPCSHDVIVHNFLAVVRDVRSKGLNPRIAILDTIVSVPGVRFPFERLTEACRKEAILSCVDGAHGIGQIDLDLAKLDADFFTTNCHKWFYTPRPSALLHVPSRNQHLMRTSYPTSYGFQPREGPRLRSSYDVAGQNAFTALFQWVGTSDCSPFICFQAAQHFRSGVCGGDAKIHSYLKHIAGKGGALVAQALGTKVMDESPDGDSQLRDCAFANVLIPIRIASQSHEDSSEPAVVVDTNPKGGALATISGDEVFNVARWMEKTFVREYNTFAMIYDYKGQLWCRLSGQIYLEEADFEYFGTVLKAVCERVGNGDGRDEWGRNDHRAE